MTVPTLAGGFSRTFAARPDAGFFSPGRVNLLGEHTDYNDGWVLPVATHLGNRFAVRKAGNDRIRIRSSLFPDDGFETALPKVAALRPTQHWSDYFVGVMREMLPLSGGAFGLDLYVDSDLPAGGGLSSSASITVGFATLLNEHWRTSLSREQVAGVALRAENNFVGLACGILDPFAVAMGKRGHAIALNCGSMEWEALPFPDRDFSIVVANTGVVRRLSESGYNQRRRECEAALRHLKQCDPGLQNLSTLDADALKSDTGLDAYPTLFRRARHIVSENARVKNAIRALRRADMDSFGRLLGESHQSLKTDFEVSCDELDIMVEEAVQLDGAVGAKMTGAGFGGCAVIVVRSDAAGGFVHELGERYRSRTRIPADVYVIRTGDGASRLDIQEQQG